MGRVILNAVGGGNPQLESEVLLLKERMATLSKDNEELRKEMEDVGSNPNILINANFCDPINQRKIEQPSWWTLGIYGLDRWFAFNSQLNYSNADVLNPTIINWGCTTMDDNGLTFTGEILQRIEPQYISSTKTYTVSALIDGEILSGSLYYGDLQENILYPFCYTDNTVISFMNCIDSGTGLPTIVINSRTATPINIKWIKLEEGDKATKFIDDEHNTKLLKCRRYYQADLRAIALPSTSNYHLISYNMIPPMRVTPRIVSAAGYANSNGYFTQINESYMLYTGGKECISQIESSGTGNLGILYFNLDAEL